MILTGAVERGSTPRMRGVFAGSLYHLIDVRFNPAYAGSIKATCKLSAIDTGSTPRMRGVYLNLYQITSQIRFNPAYAGSIAPRQRSSQHAQVQPRVCGEYILPYSFLGNATGSTPRMRGVYHLYAFGVPFFRFNPAYAGSIIHKPQAKHIYQVQPRVCGEYPCNCPLDGLYTGSTPRMRGVFMTRLFFSSWYRFNPAYAGSIQKLTHLCMSM